MDREIPSWVVKLKTSVPEWLNGLMTPGAPFGRFRFANNGCVYLPYDIISVHSAADIYQKLRLDKTLTPRQKKEWVDLSLSWRDPETGEVRDPEGIEKGVPDNDDLACSVTALRRSLNRGCIGVFGCGEGRPVLQREIKKFLDIGKMREAFDAEPWKTGSWGAGAHCAHYILAMIQWRKAGHLEFDHPINEAVKYLYSRQHPDTGAFGGENQDANNIIGGMLKIYVRLFGTLRLKIQYPERMIDTAIALLRSGELKGNCPAHNALIVLLMCKNFTDYRLKDIREEAYLSFERDIYSKLKSDGAFCYNQETSEYYYWGVKMVKSGYNQSEIHTTGLMLQAVRVIAELLDVETKLNFAPTGWKRRLK